MKNWFVYGTGRVPGIDELAEIAEVTAATRETGDPLRDLLKGVVKSRAFLEQYDTPQPPKNKEPR